MHSSKPKLSIVCVTFNHAKYIKDALEGFIRQKTNFPFEVIIHDDASTDGTTEIIKEYEHKYPNIIKPIYQTENQWRKAKTMSKTFIYPHIKGEYVAFCEGDDYWTDENKLQKQVDFLEAHPDYTICFHPVNVIWEDNRAEATIFPSAKSLQKTGNLDFSSLLKGNFIQTNSVVYRWRFHKDSYDLIPDNILPGDWFLHLLHAQIGKIGFINDVMAVYRRNSGGIWTEAGQSAKWFCSYGPAYLLFLYAFEKQFLCPQYQEISFMKRAIYYAALCRQRLDLIKEFSSFPVPSKYKFVNVLNLIRLKFMHKITYGNLSDRYMAAYRSLKLYIMWSDTTKSPE